MSTPSLRLPILGLDVSDKRIGLALAEHAAVLPAPLFTYQRTTRARDIVQCVAWVEKYGASAVVIGLPLNMDGTAGPRARWMERFADELRARIAVPVFLQDERLSTVEAEEIVADRGRDPDMIDAIAAALIVQRFLQEGEGRV